MFLRCKSCQWQTWSWLWLRTDCCSLTFQIWLMSKVRPKLLTGDTSSTSSTRWSLPSSQTTLESWCEAEGIRRQKGTSSSLKSKATSTTWLQEASKLIEVSWMKGAYPTPNEWFLYTTHPCIGARGKAVHLLSAALTSKKRKRPERQERNMNLPYQLGSA